MKIEIGKTYNGARVVSIEKGCVEYYNRGCKCYCSISAFEEKYAKEEIEQK